MNREFLTERNITEEDRIREILDGTAAETVEVHCFDRVDSTMTLARNLAELKNGPYVVVAKDQFAGRGRQGRSWVPSPGSLYYTLASKVSGSVSSLSGYSLVVGVVLAHYIEALGGKVWLKWPNDLLMEGHKKCGGILVETISEGSDLWVFTGIGMNIMSSPDVVPEASFLAELIDEPPSASEIAGALTVVLFEAWNLFNKRGFLAFKEDWLVRAAYLNQSVSLDLGDKQVTGVMRGVSDGGLLLLQVDGGIREIATGHFVT